VETVAVDLNDIQLNHIERNGVRYVVTDFPDLCGASHGVLRAAFFNVYTPNIRASVLGVPAGTLNDYIPIIRQKQLRYDFRWVAELDWLEPWQWCGFSDIQAIANGIDIQNVDIALRNYYSK
jgi:hypothetical protein